MSSPWLSVRFSLFPKPKAIVIQSLLVLCVYYLCISSSYMTRMESTEKCEAVIGHFNGKFIKTPPGVSGMLFYLKFYQSSLI